MWLFLVIKLINSIDMSQSESELIFFAQLKPFGHGLIASRSRNDTHLIRFETNLTQSGQYQGLELGTILPKQSMTMLHEFILHNSCTPTWLAYLSKSFLFYFVFSSFYNV